MAVYFTSDHHFGHGGAMGRWKRPFANVAEMDRTMVERWNGTVGPDDTVWHLGDFAIRRSATVMAGILDGLNGTKHLIHGNNDGPDTLALTGWASVAGYAETVAEDGTGLVLCHYAFRTWNGMYKGSWNLHGHSHGALKGMTRQVDVGVDVWDFRPVTFAQIRERFTRRRKSA